MLTAVLIVVVLVWHLPKPYSSGVVFDRRMFLVFTELNFPFLGQHHMFVVIVLCSSVKPVWRLLCTGRWLYTALWWTKTARRCQSHSAMSSTQMSSWMVERCVTVWTPLFKIHLSFYRLALTSLVMHQHLAKAWGMGCSSPNLSAGLLAGFFQNWLKTLREIGVSWAYQNAQIAVLSFKLFQGLCPRPTLGEAVVPFP